LVWRRRDGKAACTGPVGVAATRDNGHVDDNDMFPNDGDDDYIYEHRVGRLYLLNNVKY